MFKLMQEISFDILDVESKIMRFSQKQPPEVFYKKGVLKNFRKFTGKHLC